MPNIAPNKNEKKRKQRHHFSIYCSVLKRQLTIAFLLPMKVHESPTTLTPVVTQRSLLALHNSGIIPGSALGTEPRLAVCKAGQCPSHSTALELPVLILTLSFS